MRILQVEDLRELRTLPADVLREAGHEIVEAHDFPTTCAALTKPPAYDAVVTDVMLPGGLRGLQIAEMARQAAIPVRADTGNPDAMTLL